MRDRESVSIFLTGVASLSVIVSGILSASAYAGEMEHIPSRAVVGKDGSQPSLAIIQVARAARSDDPEATTPETDAAAESLKGDTKIPDCRSDFKAFFHDLETSDAVQKSAKLVRDLHDLVRMVEKEHLTRIYENCTKLGEDEDSIRLCFLADARVRTYLNRITGKASTALQLRRSLQNEDGKNIGRLIIGTELAGNTQLRASGDARAVATATLNVRIDFGK